MNMVDILFNNEIKSNTRNVVSEKRCNHNSSKSITGIATVLNMRTTLIVI